MCSSVARSSIINTDRQIISPDPSSKTLQCLEHVLKVLQNLSKRCALGDWEIGIDGHGPDRL